MTLSKVMKKFENSFFIQQLELEFFLEMTEFSCQKLPISGCNDGILDWKLKN